jgi:ribonuclease R
MTHNDKRKTKKMGFSPGVIGTLDISKQGMGFVIVTGMTTDIKIKRENLKDAMHGDTVEVHIFKVNKTSSRPEGVISKVLKRGQSELIGTVQLNMRFAFVVPDNKSFTKDIFIGERNAKGLKDGDRVVVKIIEWNERMKNPEGEIVSVLTNERNNEIAMKEILLQNGFSLEFPKAVIDELGLIPLDISSEEIKCRRDLRDTFTITIDPHDAKDFDDAISLKKLPNGNYEIGVHIADVSHYVKAGTALDQEAIKRATSVYLPDRVLPMLPEKISNELCSLRPKEDKLTFSVIFEIDATAKVLNYEIAKTIIHSNRRYTYEEVQEIIESKQGDHLEEVLLLHSISQQFRQRKFDEGAINFSSEEVRFVLDEKGVPIDVLVKQSKECHQLIEELMLLANRTVAEHVHKIKFKNAPIPFPYRVHDTPDIEKLKKFVSFAGKFGLKFDLKSPQTIAKSFNEMVKKTQNHPEQSVLHTLGIRTMAKAIYTPENIGHYGLAFEYYCHFTSPIRRYPDVLVHRVVFEILNNDIHPIKNMEQFCLHCSERERKAMESEREASKYKQVEFMRKFIGEEFSAVISGVGKFGFWAQTIQHKCEGFISITDLNEIDDFIFEESEYAFVGKHTKMKFKIGQPIEVLVAAANLERKQIDYKIILDVPVLDSTKKSKMK